MLIHNNSEQYSFSSKMKKLKISWQDWKYYTVTCRKFTEFTEDYESPRTIPMSIYYLITALDSISDFRYCGCSRPFRFLGKNQRSLTKIYQRGKDRIATKYHP